MFNTYYFFKTFKKQRSYERNINNIIIANNEYNISDLNKTNILEKTVTELLLKLSEFEKSELFLNKNLSLSRLASYCNSNSRYVSVILNTHKNQDFYEYLSRLRIKYIIEKLNHNPKYRKFKIAALSEEAGFSSHNKFCSVFKRYIGITPSEYIKNIDNIISTIEDKI